MYLACSARIFFASPASISPSSKADATIWSRAPRCADAASRDPVLTQAPYYFLSAAHGPPVALDAARTPAAADALDVLAGAPFALPPGPALGVPGAGAGDGTGLFCSSS